MKTYSKRMMWNPAQEKLVDQVAKLNDKRFQAMIKLKVSRALMLITKYQYLLLFILINIE